MHPGEIAVFAAKARRAASMSQCPRSAVGAVLVDPHLGRVIATGHNHGCPPGVCLRDGLPSGERVEVGCIHAEMDVLMQCSRSLLDSEGKWLVVTKEPCAMCAKLLKISGVARVIVVENK